MLKGQQILSPLAVCKAFPIKDFGTFGPRPFLPPPFFPRPFPLALADGALGGVLDLLRSAFGLIGFGVPLSAGAADLVGNGSKWKDTEGWASAFSNSVSKGRLPWPSLLRVLIFSAIMSQAALSARKICAKETEAYPGGGGWCK